MLGPFSGVHEDIERLASALEMFRAQNADRPVFLGDAYDTGERIVETRGLLARTGVPGAWGKHDFGLCAEVAEDVAAKIAPDVLACMATQRPRIEIGDRLFQHVEPWLDPERLDDLWQ